MTQPEPWRRLSPGTMVVQPVEQLPQLIPALIALVFAGQSAPVFSLLATVVVVLLVTVLPWLTTRYQVTPEHVQVRKGLLTRKVVTARRDRIRSVDLTAGPVHRILGLKKVIIGTGGDKDSATVKLNALSAADADGLHGYLMTTAPRGDVPAVDVDHQPVTVLTRFRPEWLRYSPFSMAGLATAGAALGLGAQIANDAGLFERSVGTAERAADAVRGIPVAVVIIIVVVGVIGLGSALSVLGYILRFWNFTLTRHPDGTLRTERGLLTTNAVSFDESRIRGTHLHEPVLMRPVHGARLGGIAIGHIKHPLLLPPAPKDEAVRVGNLVADDGVELTMPLVEHGRTARTRRLNRAAMAGAAALILSGIPAVTGGPVWFLALGVIALAASMTFGVARYRHLGHAITDQSVVIAPPKIARHRNALDRDGIVGWATRASWFQRRADVRTVILATAAGSEGYELVDLDDAASDRVIATTAPPWMRQFLAAVE